MALLDCIQLNHTGIMVTQTTQHTVILNTQWKLLVDVSSEFICSPVSVRLHVECKPNHLHISRERYHATKQLPYTFDAC